MPSEEEVSTVHKLDAETTNHERDSEDDNTKKVETRAVHRD